MNGEWKSQKLAFAKYPTLAACFSAHGCLLQCGPYAPAWQRYQANHDLDAYIRAIGEDYATDPSYAPKLVQLAHGPHVDAALGEARRREAEAVSTG